MNRSVFSAVVGPRLDASASECMCVVACARKLRWPALRSTRPGEGYALKANDSKARRALGAGSSKSAGMARFHMRPANEKLVIGARDPTTWASSPLLSVPLRVAPQSIARRTQQLRRQARSTQYHVRESWDRLICSVRGRLASAGSREYLERPPQRAMQASARKTRL